MGKKKGNKKKKRIPGTSRYFLSSHPKKKPPGWDKPKKVVGRRCEICADPTANKPDGLSKVLCNRAKKGLEYANRSNENSKSNSKTVETG